MEKTLRAQTRHLESSTALWTLSALALAACGGGGGGGGPTVTDPATAAGDDDTSPESFLADTDANILTGGAGVETFDGSADEVDVAHYKDSPSGVTINLSATDTGGYATASGGNAEGDRLKNIEIIIGSAHDDVLIGDAGNNWLWGGAGADTLDGGDGDDRIHGGAGDDKLAGGAGADTLDGGFGYDIASYDGSSSGITIALDEKDTNGYSSITGGEAQGNKLRNIEGIIGTAHHDELWGDGGANSFWGGDGGHLLGGKTGDDTLYGGDGNDSLLGHDGNDTLYGGAGADTLKGWGGADVFVLEVEGATDLTTAGVIEDFTSGIDELTFSTETSGKKLWYQNGVDAGVGHSSLNDTVIYGDKDGAADKNDIIVILADHDGAITSADFVDETYVGTITEIS